MNDESANPAFLDDQCINVTNAIELHVWAKSLGAAREEIRAAVAKVGPLIDKVIEHLRPS